MCNTCGCGIYTGAVRIDGARAATGGATVNVVEGLLAANDRQAEHNRTHFDAHGVLAVNLMSSPGAGKTALLEATIEALKDELTMAVVEGDLETENDAARIRSLGVTAIQISTGSACHLDATMVHAALHRLDLDGLDLIFIENVGNLVCPASFDLGQHRNVTLLSVPEGDDKPAKYPVIFRAADSVLVTKADLLPIMPEFSVARAERYTRALASAAPLFTLSARTGAGMPAWLDWLRGELSAQADRRAAGRTTRARTQPEGAALHAAPAAGE